MAQQMSLIENHAFELWECLNYISYRGK
jgi:hypothetical protein